MISIFWFINCKAHTNVWLFFFFFYCGSCRNIGEKYVLLVYFFSEFLLYVKHHLMVLEICYQKIHLFILYKPSDWSVFLPITNQHVEQQYGTHHLLGVHEILSSTQDGKQYIPYTYIAFSHLSFKHLTFNHTSSVMHQHHMMLTQGWSKCLGHMTWHHNVYYRWNCHSVSATVTKTRLTRVTTVCELELSLIKPTFFCPLTSITFSSGIESWFPGTLFLTVGASGKINK